MRVQFYFQPLPWFTSSIQIPHLNMRLPSTSSIHFSIPFCFCIWLFTHTLWWDSCRPPWSIPSLPSASSSCSSAILCGTVSRIASPPSLPHWTRTAQRSHFPLEQIDKYISSLVLNLQFFIGFYLHDKRKGEGLIFAIIFLGICINVKISLTLKKREHILTKNTMMSATVKQWLPCLVPLNSYTASHNLFSSSGSHFPVKEMILIQLTCTSNMFMKYIYI